MSIQIEEYVRQTYKKRFKDKPVLITENDACLYGYTPCRRKSSYIK